MTRILVTGANGFVGTATLKALSAVGQSVVAGVRAGGGRSIHIDTDLFDMPDLSTPFDLTGPLKGIETVIHSAARVHAMHETEAEAATRHQAINTAGTLRLAGQAAAAGVRRFVYLSTVKVLGETTRPDRPFTDDTAPNPGDSYSRSKLAAEDGLFALSARTGMEVVVLRPPLVYGAGVRANFAALVRLCDSPWALPFGAIAGNRRSFIHVDNLADILLTACRHPTAPSRRLLVADGTCLSTAELCERLRHALGRPRRLMPVPPALVVAAGAMLGRHTTVRRLTESLVVEPTGLRRDLGWLPAIGLDEAMARTVQSRGRTAAPRSRDV